MESFFRWLEDLPLSVAVAQSQSIWGFSFVLVLHTVGIALTAGSTTIISLRLLGVAAPLPLSSLRLLVKLFWVGFVMNAFTGTLLFMMAATTTGEKPIYYAKLAFLALGLIAFRWQSRVVSGDSASAADEVSPRMRQIALLSLACWAGVITTGRLIAYVG